MCQLKEIAGSLRFARDSFCGGLCHTLSMAGLLDPFKLRVFKVAHYHISRSRHKLLNMRYSLALLLLVLGWVRLAETQSAKTKFEDFNASPEERAADLVSRMTLAEKVSQMQNA